MILLLWEAFKKMSNLKLCPFCGKEVEIVYIGSGWFWRHKIEPPLPLCPITHSRKYSTREMVESLWNKRIPEPLETEKGSAE